MDNCQEAYDKGYGEGYADGTDGIGSEGDVRLVAELRDQVTQLQEENATLRKSYSDCTRDFINVVNERNSLLDQVSNLQKYIKQLTKVVEAAKEIVYYKDLWYLDRLAQALSGLDKAGER